MLRSPRHWTVLAAALVLAGCTQVLAPPGGSPAITNPGLSAETPLSAQHADILAAYGGVFRDSELERAVAEIAGRLVAASTDPSRSYRITILNSAAINAFALPDGRLYVTRGLLTLANDASEVAAVIAHEMAHVTANHAALRQNLGLGAVAVGTAVASASDPATAAANDAASQGIIAGFSRQQELEADTIGIATVTKAGYDPFAAARFLTAMARFSAYRSAGGVSQDQRAEFLASHPSNPDRIAAANAAAAATPGGGQTGHDAYLTALNGVAFGDDPRFGYVRGQTYYNAGLRIAFGIPEGFTVDIRDEAVLATGPDGTALRFDTIDLPFGQALTDYLASGWVNGLDRSSIGSAIVNGLPAATASASTQGWEFRIAIIQANSGTYRFIFARPAVTQNFLELTAAIPASFRQLSATEIAELQPLAVRVAVVAAGDTPASIAAQMTGVDRPLDLFLILNGLDASATLTAGASVKVISER